ncbi:hypothetical protein N431DRAFT_426670 [Stipitochalara longipes BDJ]|nr:hypothetical protein N431DRAFT_426670 [Stipitochalara longipes BDJ]
MAPISSRRVETRPNTRLEIRQTVQPYVITQTIADLSTTYTTPVTLGTYIVPAAPTPTPSSTPPPTVAPAAPAKTSTDNSGVVIGAVLGTLLGLAVLLALIWKCCFDGRSVLWNPWWGGEEDDRSYRSGSPSLGSSGSSRSRRRVKRRGGYVRRPRRAHVRRDRRGSGSYDEGWGEEKRRGSRTVKNGMVGWTIGGSGGRRSERRRSDRRSGEWVASERVRMRFTTDD